MIKLATKISGLYKSYLKLLSDIVKIQESLGRIENRQIANSTDYANSEFRVFSQWGEDGIIQYLISKVPIDKKIFVEFGVENYLESNTRFLLTNNLWSGLVIDGSTENIKFIRRDQIYWATNLKTECSFITRENINELLLKNGVEGDIGLLSVDIDGNDYWVWDAINTISPRIVICEYNSHFGPTVEVTTPYNPSFVRDSAHFSKIYYGASIAALYALAKIKGYSLVAANSAGNNAFFLRNDLVGSMSVLTPIEAYRRAQFREFHNEAGQLTYDDFQTRLNKISDLQLYNLKNNTLMKISEIPGLIA